MTTQIAEGGQDLNLACLFYGDWDLQRELLALLPRPSLLWLTQLSLHRGCPHQPGALRRRCSTWGKIHAVGPQGSVGKHVTSGSRFFVPPHHLAAWQSQRQGRAEVKWLSTL